MANDQGRRTNAYLRRLSMGGPAPYSSSLFLSPPSFSSFFFPFSPRTGSTARRLARSGCIPQGLRWQYIPFRRPATTSARWLSRLITEKKGPANPAGTSRRCIYGTRNLKTQTRKRRDQSWVHKKKTVEPTVVKRHQCRQPVGLIDGVRREPSKGKRTGGSKTDLAGPGAEPRAQSRVSRRGETGCRAGSRSTRENARAGRIRLFANPAGESDCGAQPV